VQNDSTPLHLAAINGHVGCVALLVERGANTEATSAKVLHRSAAASVQHQT
jgi:ankyrin repeat protein